MNENLNLYSIALSITPGIKPVIAKKLLDLVGDAESVFLRRRELADLSEEVTPRLIEALDNPEVISRAAEEIHIAEKNNITILSYGSEHYPSRLKECEDASVVLFYKGNADLNVSKVISMVGTRKITHYGK